MAAHTPSPLRFWRIEGFNCWSAVAGWPEKTGNSPLAQSRRCRLIAVMTAALRLLGPMDRTRLSEWCLLTPKPTDLLSFGWSYLPLLCALPSVVAPLQQPVASCDQPTWPRGPGAPLAVPWGHARR